MFGRFSVEKPTTGRWGGLLGGVTSAPCVTSETLKRVTLDGTCISNYSTGVLESMLQLADYQTAWRLGGHRLPAGTVAGVPSRPLSPLKRGRILKGVL